MSDSTSPLENNSNTPFEDDSLALNLRLPESRFPRKQYFTFALIFLGLFILGIFLSPMVDNTNFTWLSIMYFICIMIMGYLIGLGIRNEPVKMKSSHHVRNKISGFIILGMINLLTWVFFYLTNLQSLPVILFMFTLFNARGIFLIVNIYLNNKMDKTLNKNEKEVVTNN